MPDLRAIAALALTAGLAACAPGDDGAGTDAGPSAAVGGDACGASGFANLVGTSVGELNPSTLPEPRRIIFPGQAVTTDVQAGRLNVEIGEDDLVARVYCG